MNGISKNTKRRLIELLGILEGFEGEKITSVGISKFTGWKDSLVRRDFKSIGFCGGVSNGYDVLELKNAIKSALGLSFEEGTQKKRCCIVGLGRLGSALLDSDFFAGSGFEVVCGFDSSVNRIEVMRSVFELFPASQIESVILQKQIEYAILCVPESQLPLMIDRLVKANIKGIVNMTKTLLQVPDTIKVVNASVVFALQELG